VDTRLPASAAQQAACRRALVGSVVGCISVSALTSCGGPSTTSALPQPEVINLYPVGGTSENPARLFVLIQSVGLHAVTLPLAFDTGSAGITINALSVFPTSMVTPNGFSFPPGQMSLEYQGITVTDQQGTRVYGGSTGRTEYGNIGYATVTFGDQHGTLTTEALPMFLYYAVTSNATGELASPQQQQGWFGVNSAPNIIVIPGSTEPPDGYPACSEEITGSCYVDSVLKHIPYSSGIDAGFALAPAALAACNVSVPDGCPAAPMLTVGLTSATTQGFNSTGLTCPPPGFLGPTAVGQYAVCQPDVMNTMISSEGQSFKTTVLFDSGTPFVSISVPRGQTFMPPAGSTSVIGGTTVESVLDGTPVNFTTPNGFAYAIVAGGGVDSVQVTQGSSAQSVVGLPYFTTNSFFIDFTNNTEGWK
jgi:hypothetical protein